MDKIKDQLFQISEIDAFIIMDENKAILSEFYQDYLSDIDLSFFKQIYQTEQPNSHKQILLTEKGMIYLHRLSEVSVVLLAGFRESTDIYELEAKLATILN